MAVIHRNSSRKESFRKALKNDIHPGANKSAASEGEVGAASMGNCSCLSLLYNAVFHAKVEAICRFDICEYLRGGGGANIHKYASIARSCRIDYPWNLSIGELSSIGSGAWVYALDKIEIGKNVCIGENVRLITGSHDIVSPHFDLVTEPITICDNVWVATGAVVLPGVMIGEGAVVGACAVVTKDVEPWTVVGGNPAKFIKKRELKDD